jgi:hypothetical protein
MSRLSRGTTVSDHRPRPPSRATVSDHRARDVGRQFQVKTICWIHWHGVVWPSPHKTSRLQGLDWIRQSARCSRCHPHRDWVQVGSTGNVKSVHHWLQLYKKSLTFTYWKLFKKSMMRRNLHIIPSISSHRIINSAGERMSRKSRRHCRIIHCCSWTAGSWFVQWMVQWLVQFLWP